jgi:RNA polymerase sigma-70 factor (ECF subfamily)
MSAASPRPAPRPAQLDQLTLRRAQRGEAPAWRALIELHQGPVHALIWRLLAGRARHRAEDLTQDTFVRVLRALPDFDPRGPATLSTWILTIATRLALNELRGAASRSVRGLDDAPEATAVHAHDRADHATDRRQLGDAIAAGVAGLPEDQRAVLVLREYHGLDYAELAAALDLDLGTVKSRLARARAALRAHLEATVPDHLPQGRHA